METMRWRGSATRWNKTGLVLGRIYGGVLVVATVAYPVFMVYLGDISGIENWGGQVKAGVAVGTAIGVLVVIMMGAAVVLGGKPDPQDLKHKLVRNLIRKIISSC